MRTWVAPSLCLFALLPLSLSFQKSNRFTPTHKIAGIGAERPFMSDDVLDLRTGLMIQSQTFAIMRDASALPGAERIWSPKLQALFRDAERTSGFPASTLSAISYLESWGLSTAESPSGPKGIMQISEGTARSMGLKVLHATKYKIATVTKTVRGRKRTVRTKTPYTVTVRDDRLVPERAIPAAAAYLARLEQKFNGRDWAIFAYHCGEGCVSYLRSIAEMANGFRDHPLTVARMFFNCSPAYNRNLYEAIQTQMQRDYSPTYWFRVQRAEELLALDRADPAAFRQLGDDYRSDLITARAPNRLSVWLRSTDLAYHSSQDIRADLGKRLVKAFDNPDYFGYRVRASAPDLDLLASPATVGTLAYIAYETRRIFEQIRPAGESFQPLEVTALVQAMDAGGPQSSPEQLGHSTGHVFDIEYTRLPPAERECLRFVLDDLGWYGYLGFGEESPGDHHLHIGCSPASRDFFALVFQEALAGTAVAQNAAGN